MWQINKVQHLALQVNLNRYHNDIKYLKLQKNINFNCIDLLHNIVKITAQKDKT